MWLLDVLTTQLVNFHDDRKVIGRYAILSHTWEEEEVTYHDIHKPGARNMKGYKKIEYTCQQAKKDGLEYAWVDTCCINKESSAELSEAINSMWRWYWNSKVCYAYLSDKIEPLEIDDRWPRLSGQLTYDLSQCRWFTRGWTLQELLAPTTVRFYDRKWNYIGRRNALAKALAEITHIKQKVLEQRELIFREAVATRLSWAARRKTTREEDEAYSLMGLFGVHMPLLYGEGSRAFLRLQEEIIRTCQELSVLAWQAWEPEQCGMLLAPSCYGFRNSAVHEDLTRDSGLDISSRGLEGSYLVQRQLGSVSFAPYIARGEGGKHVALRLRRAELQLDRIQRFEVVRPLNDFELRTFGGVPRPGGEQSPSVFYQQSDKIILSRHSLAVQVILEVEGAMEISGCFETDMTWTYANISYAHITFPRERCGDTTRSIAIRDFSSGESSWFSFGPNENFIIEGGPLCIGWYRGERDGGGASELETLLEESSATWRPTRGRYEIVAEVTPFDREDPSRFYKENQGWIVRIEQRAKKE